MFKPDWTPSGHRVYYYPDGVTKRYEGTYKDGIKQGEFTYYSSDGKRRAVIYYVDGVVTGTPKLFDRGNEHTSVLYEFDFGILKSSVHYNNSNVIGVYSYEDKNRFPDPNLPLPPPVGTMWQGSSTIENPTEIFRGTVWSWIKNSYYIDEDGITRDVTIWLREPDSTGGGIYYGPYLVMNEFTEMREDGATLNTGEYIRKIVNDESTSVLHGIENAWDYESGLPIMNFHWNMGDETKVEVLELNNVTIQNQRVWQEIIIKNTKATTGWYAAYDISQDIHTVLTPTFNYTFDQNTQVASIVQYKQDTLG